MKNKYTVQLIKIIIIKNNNTDKYKTILQTNLPLN